MHVVIPVAGFGTRLRPHTYTKPKPLMKVAGNTILGYILDMLKDAGLEEVTFIVGYLGDQIREYVETHYTFRAHYVEQTELKGQAHAIALARELVRDPMLIIFADTIFDANLRELPHITSDGVVYVKEVEDPRRFGIVTLNSEGVIDQFVEKPEKPISNLAIIGVYYIRDYQGLFEAIDELIARNIKTKGEYFLADALQIMVNRGARLEIRPVSIWEDCGTPEALLNANRYLLEQGKTASESLHASNTLIIPPVHIAPGVILESSIIGPYVSMAEGCVVRNSIIRDAIVDEEATIEDTMLMRSLVGKNAEVRGRFRRLNVGDSSVVDFTL
ncbi:MAG: sugar phosphate nucleotidyltransferase [Ardenticatenia bacterium]|nr:sugar phosphate nucleotidyltransferase [Ardenticatenia bacterium]